MLQHVGAKSRIHLLPAAQVGSRLVQQVTVAGREQVLHEDDRGADGHQQEELAGPTLVIVMRILWRAGGVSGSGNPSWPALLPFPESTRSQDSTAESSGRAETNNDTPQKHSTDAVPTGQRPMVENCSAAPADMVTHGCLQLQFQGI